MSRCAWSYPAGVGDRTGKLPHRGRSPRPEPRARPSSRPGKAQPQPVQGFVQAAHLTRTAATRIPAHHRPQPRHQRPDARISGSLNDFAHPHWQAKAVGELDLRLIDPITGYPFAPEGLAHLDLDRGRRGRRLSRRRHNPCRRWLVHRHRCGRQGRATRCASSCRSRAVAGPSIVARLSEGGQIDGDLNTLRHWFAVRFSGAATHGTSQPGHPAARAVPAVKPLAPSSSQAPDEITLPINGKETANLQRMSPWTRCWKWSADPPFQHLGFDTRNQWPRKGASGSTATPARSRLTHLLNLTPPAQTAQGKVAASGLIDATYTQRDGAVDLRKFGFAHPRQSVGGFRPSGRLPAQQSKRSGCRVPFAESRRVRRRSARSGIDAQRKVRNRGLASRSRRPGRLCPWLLERLPARSAHHRQPQGYATQR